jgi:flagellar protein FlgJ
MADWREVFGGYRPSDLVEDRRALGPDISAYVETLAQAGFTPEEISVALDIENERNLSASQERQARYGSVQPGWYDRNELERDVARIGQGIKNGRTDLTPLTGFSPTAKSELAFSQDMTQLLSGAPAFNDTFARSDRAVSRNDLGLSAGMRGKAAERAVQEGTIKADYMGGKAKPSGAANHKEAFIQNFGPMIAEVSRRTGINPELVAAHAALESGWGKKTAGNNMMGIKGKGVTVGTWEDTPQGRVSIKDSFRAYPSKMASLLDYANLMNKNFPEVGKARTTREQVAALDKSAYATDKNQAAKLGAIAKDIAGMPSFQDVIRDQQTQMVDEAMPAFDAPPDPFGLDIFGPAQPASAGFSLPFGGQFADVLDDSFAPAPMSQAAFDGVFDQGFPAGPAPMSQDTFSDVFTNGMGNVTLGFNGPMDEATGLGYGVAPLSAAGWGQAAGLDLGFSPVDFGGRFAGEGMPSPAGRAGPRDTGMLQAGFSDPGFGSFNPTERSFSAPASRESFSIGRPTSDQWANVGFMDPSIAFAQGDIAEEETAPAPRMDFAAVDAKPRADLGALQSALDAAKDRLASTPATVQQSYTANPSWGLDSPKERGMMSRANEYATRSVANTQALQAAKAEVAKREAALAAAQRATPAARAAGVAAARPQAQPTRALPSATMAAPQAQPQVPASPYAGYAHPLDAMADIRTGKASMPSGYNTAWGQKAFGDDVYAAVAFDDLRNEVAKGMGHPTTKNLGDLYSELPGGVKGGLTGGLRGALAGGPLGALVGAGLGAAMGHYAPNGILSTLGLPTPGQVLGNAARSVTGFHGGVPGWSPTIGIAPNQPGYGVSNGRDSSGALNDGSGYQYGGYDTRADWGGWNAHDLDGIDFSGGLGGYGGSGGGGGYDFGGGGWGGPSNDSPHGNGGAYGADRT